ncbi:DNA polymerase III subunit gamma/tau [Candidatus Saccharibacteria bacterium]|nr:DNA polymerase III subunit gamma/tau [Candidatus Saccharibacteria bacterium]
MKSLYRRYRPLSLADVVGEEQVTGPLIKSLEQNKINHAYLFIGPRGCGKTSVARILAHEVNGFKYDIEDEYIDIIEIDGASNRGIDNIRELREKVAIAPSSGKYKVYIIDEVHMLTKEAFNALLKTLEEPPKHVIFIMATTDAYKVPVTITSRAQCFTFKLAEPDVMFDYLKKITDKEKIKITDGAIRIIIKRGGGSFRDTLSLLDQLSSLSQDEITEEMVINAMGLPEDEKIKTLLAAYKSSDTSGVFNIVKELLSAGIKADTIADELIATIIESPEPDLIGLLAELPNVKAPYSEAKLLVALSGALKKTSVAALQPATHAATQTTAHPAAQASAQPAAKPSFKDRAKLASAQPKAPAAPVSQPAKVIAEEEPIQKPKPSENVSFDWEKFLAIVMEKSDVLHSQLGRTNHSFDGEALHIYPTKKITKNIIGRENNKKILQEAAGVGVKITIHDVTDSPNDTKNDATLSRLSDIMGGEVLNDRGGNPF